MEERSTSTSSVKIIITNDCSLSIPTTGFGSNSFVAGSEHSSLRCQLGESPDEYQKDVDRRYRRRTLAEIPRMNSGKDTVVETSIVEPSKWNFKRNSVQNCVTKIYRPDNRRRRSKKYQNRRSSSSASIRRIGSVDKERIAEILSSAADGSCENLDETSSLAGIPPKPFRTRRFNSSPAAEGRRIPKLVTQLSTTSCYGSTDLARRDSCTYETSTDYWETETPPGGGSDWSLGGQCESFI